VRRLDADQQALVAGASGLVHALAAQVSRSWKQLSFDELVSAGYEALVRAATRYDPSRGTRFEVFAYRHVHGEMVNAAYKEARHGHWRRAALGALRRAGAPSPLPVRLDETPPSEQGPDSSRERARARAVQWSRNTAASMLVAALYSTLVAGAPEEELLAREAFATLEQAIDSLPEDQRLLLDLHYRRGLSLGDIAQAFGRSRRTVERAHHQVKEALAEKLRALGITRPPALEGVPPPDQ